MIITSAPTDENQKPKNQTIRIYRPDGSLRWVTFNSFPVKDHPVGANYLVSVVQDITSHNLVDQALRKALDRTREQFTLSRRMSLARRPEVVLKTLMSARELRSAQRAALFFFEDPKAGPTRGVDLAETWVSPQNNIPWPDESSLYEEPAFWGLVEQNQTIVINGVRSSTRLGKPLREVLLEGKVHTLVIFSLVSSGDWLGSLIIFFGEDTRFSHNELRNLKVLIDQATISLHNLRLLEIEAVSRHEAERANEIKTEFLAMISHELRTPLTSIVGFTTTLLAPDVTWDKTEQFDFIQTIQQESFRLQELIDHLLDLSRLEAGRLPIQLKPHNLVDVLQDASPQLNTVTKGKTLSINLPENLPPVFIDNKRIAQVLVNLVKNASNYSPKGTEISISANARGNFLQVNVNDQGPGIPPAERIRVFEAFRRGITEETGSAKGAGLGLAICKGLVEAHNGRIWVKKKSPPGTTISFTLPLVPEENQEIPDDKEK
jgi:signal transduction histidine kinase